MTEEAGLLSYFQYDSEVGHVTRQGKRVGYNHPTGYRYVSLGRKNYKEHRLAWLLNYGRWPETDLDHINRRRSDNRIANLREVTDAQNQRNTGLRIDNTSGFKGVCHRKDGRYVASTRVDGRKKHIGSFLTAMDAHLAYEAFVAEL